MNKKKQAAPKIKKIVRQSNTIIITEFGWTPLNDIQAISRGMREGQKNTVYFVDYNQKLKL